MTYYKIFKNGTWVPMQVEAKKTDFSVTSDGVWVLGEGADAGDGSEYLIIDGGEVSPDKVFSNVFISE
jgi:hypothetical protein